MTDRRYWEDRGGIIQEEVTAERAATCFAEAQADPNSQLEGTLRYGFEYFAYYQEGVGNAFRVIFRPLLPVTDILLPVDVSQRGNAGR